MRRRFRGSFSGRHTRPASNLQVLVVQAQNEVTMASGTATTAPSTPTTALSTAPLALVTGSCTMDSLNPIGAPLGAQDTPSVNQGAKPAICTEHTLPSIQRYATLPYFTGPPYTPPLASMAPLAYAAYTAPLASTTSLPYAAMPAMSARPTVPMGFYGQGNQFPFIPNPNWMSEREHMLQQQLLQERQQFEAALRASQAQHQPQPPITALGPPLPVGDDVDINVQRSASSTRARPRDQTNDENKRARSASTSRRSPSPKRDYPRGTCTATRPSQASPKRAEH